MNGILKYSLRILAVASIGFTASSFVESNSDSKHLFILSGQSNMARLDINETFTPTIINEFSSNKVLFVKDAKGGQPIRRWYKDWKSPSGEKSGLDTELYNKLLNKVNASIEGNDIKTVTFIWMQGERDATESYGEVYEESLKGLYNQLSRDLDRHDINFVIGRINDFDLENEKKAHWTIVRDAQVEVAESNSKFDWVNTDDLNDGINNKGKKISNDLHMSVEGYKELGRRFANKSIRIINNKH